MDPCRSLAVLVASTLPHREGDDEWVLGAVEGVVDNKGFCEKDVRGKVV